MRTTVINIKGMTCMGCVKSIKNVLEMVSGVGDANVSLEDAQVKVQHDDAISSIALLEQIIRDAGFEVV
jgi:copper chaperone